MPEVTSNKFFEKLSPDNPKIQSQKELLIKNLIKLLDEGKEKLDSNFKPFWTKKSTLNSKNLWLPNNEENLNPNIPLSESWFSVSTKKSNNLNSQKFLKSTLEEPKLINSKIFKTLKIRIFPTEEQKEKLKKTFGASRWAYNTYLNMLKVLKNSPIYYKDKKSGEDKLLHNIKGNLSNIKVREFIKRVSINRKECLTEKENNQTNINDLIEYVYDLEQKTFAFDDGYSLDNFPSRAIRGTINNIVGNLNSCLSNGNDLNSLKPRLKKGVIDFCNFDDWTSPKRIVSAKLGILKGNFKIGRFAIPMEQLIPLLEKKNFQLRHEKIIDKYFLILPATPECFQRIRNYAAENKKIKINNLKEIDTLQNKRIKFKQILNKKKIEESLVDKQNETTSIKKEIISLDPGVRTFQTGYDGSSTISICEEGIERLVDLLKKKDKLSILYCECNEEQSIRLRKRIYKVQMSITNLVDELHWKTIKFLTDNYKRIMIPEFPISQMVNKRTISKITKRSLYVLCFFKFRTRLAYKCAEKGCELIIVTEEYTSKTCGSCGFVNPKFSSKILKCKKCDLVIDRDENAARNILIKNLYS